MERRSALALFAASACVPASSRSRRAARGTCGAVPRSVGSCPPATTNRHERTLELRHERADAFTCFQYAGERPEDSKLFEDLLLVGEFDALLRASAGFDEDDVLEVFDAIAQSSGAQREAAITKLQELAKAGRFLRDEEAA